MTENAERILFVTGRLAEPSLRRVLAGLSPDAPFTWEVEVLGISVAALMHADWVLRKLNVPDGTDRVILPGWCQGDLQPLCERFQVPFERGPKDVFDLPEYLSGRSRGPVDLTEHTIEIVAEINHAPRMSDSDIVGLARQLGDDGADVIDLGCIPGESWARAGEVTGLLRQEGLRVSIDSFERCEVEAAVAAGAELVFSANRSNLEWVSALGVEVVAVPDDPRDFESLVAVVGELDSRGCRYRIDPILEPIGFGFATSLARYYEARRRWPNAPMLMGIGNVTELTDVDTAGVNVLLAALCQELAIGSVLTTQVINWARTAVREFDCARRLVHHALTNHVLPKHVTKDLLLLRDPRVHEIGADGLQELASRLRDSGFRIFAEGGELHLMNRAGYWHGTDPFDLFRRALAENEAVLDPSHSFYLGYELCKAVTALTLGKQYNQDQALTWGMLTIPERPSHAARTRWNDDSGQ